MSYHCYLKACLVSSLVLASACSRKAEFSTGQSKRTLNERPLHQDDDVVAQPSPQEGHTPILPPEGGTSVELPEEPKPSTPNALRYEKTFAATHYDNQTLTLIPQYGMVNGELVLKRDYTAASKDFTQSSRPWLPPETFMQGNAGDPVMESFRQNNIGVLDLLIVLDNSTSMGPFQANLSTKLSPLLSEIKDTDWRLGIVTTDPQGPCLNYLFSKDDPNVETKFKNAINSIGITNARSAQTEHGILNAARGLAHLCRPAGTPRWVRDRSNIAVLVVSDEENCSIENKCTADQNSNSYTFLTQYLSQNEKRTLGVDAKVYALIWHPSETKAQCASATSQGIQYANAVAATKGTWGSICDADYSKTLAAMSRDIAVSLKSQFTLRDTPSPGTLRVSVNGSDWTNKVSLAQNVITFTEVPPRDAVISVNYAVNATPLLTDFTLMASTMPDPSTLLVTINGTAVDPSEYAYDAASKTIAFVTAPPSLAKITVQYRAKDALGKTFALGTKARVGSLRASLADGTSLVIATYDKTTGIVTLATAPQDGAVVKISYDEEGAPILSYPYTISDDLVPSLRVYPKNDPTQTIAATYANGMLTLPANAFQEGAIVVLTYRDPNTRTQMVMAPHAPVLNSITYDFGRNNCRANDISYTNGYFVTQCSLLDNEAIKIAYRYVLSHSSSFTFEGLSDAEAFTWEVWVNNVASQDWTRQGATITFDPALPLDAMVRVVVVQKTGM